MAKKEYIERGKVHICLDDLSSENLIGNDNDTFISLPEAHDRIDDIPAADVVEVKHGEWRETIWKRHNLLKDYHGNPVPQYMCSLCQREEMQKEPYCHCGAKMDGDRDAGSP